MAPSSDNARLRAAWAEAVGTPIATNSIVVRRSKPGVVTVACASAAWAQELDLSRERHLRALAAAVPDLPVTGLRFVIGDHVMPADETPATPRTILPTADEMRQAEAAGVDIVDPDVRERVIRAAAGQLALARLQRKDLQRANKPGRDGRRG